MRCPFILRLSIEESTPFSLKSSNYILANQIIADKTFVQSLYGPQYIKAVAALSWKSLLICSQKREEINTDLKWFYYGLFLKNWRLRRYRMAILHNAGAVKSAVRTRWVCIEVSPEEMEARHM
jgi:hypothetical protein